MHKFHFSDPRHAFWSWARLAVYASLLGLALWKNATRFDWTEVKTLAEVAGAMAAIAATHQHVKKRFWKAEEDQ